MAERRLGAVILAAGKGTRLKTDRPKVLLEVCGRPMLAYVVDACRAAGVERCIVVVGYQKQMVIDAFAGQDDVVFVEQAEQLGTGHAVMVCEQAIRAGGCDDLLVLCGDGPLIRDETIAQLLARHRERHAAVTLATAEIDDPAGYGRIVRDASGELVGIVEHKDCTPAQRAIREINPSYYCYNAADLLGALARTGNDNAKGEYYITDTLGILIRDGKTATAITAVPPEDIFSINSRQDLALVNRVMRDRILNRLMDAGVTVVDPESTWIDVRARIGKDTVVQPFTLISGPAEIGERCVIGPHAYVEGPTRIGDDAVVGPAVTAGAGA